MPHSASITVENVSVQFPLYHGSSRSLKKMVVAAASGRLAQDTQQRVVVRALTDINLQLGRGDRLGLVGSNGAGKTTLLRVLAGIYEPAMGRLKVHGSLNALLDPIGLGAYSTASMYAPATTNADLSPEVRAAIDFTPEQTKTLNNTDYGYQAKNIAKWLEWWNKEFKG